MKKTLLMFILSLPSSCIAFAENECRDKPNISKFDRLYEVRKSTLEDGIIGLSIKVPNSYDSKYHLIALSLQELKDRRVILETAIKTELKNDVYHSDMTVHSSHLANIRLIASYSRNKEKLLLDVDYCQFNLGFEH